nr:hypothetical protein Iba_chr12dCG22060 [Ipomoea batatas]
MTNAEPPSTSDSVSLPPGTKGGNLGDFDDSEYLSDQDIAAGKSPNSMPLPPYVPAKSNALKKISGSNNDSINGGTTVSRYGSVFWPEGNFSTVNRQAIILDLKILLTKFEKKNQEGHRYKEEMEPKSPNLPNKQRPPRSSENSVAVSHLQ